MKATSNLRQAVRDYFPPPEWLVAFEVQIERPEGGLRFADAIAIRILKRGVEFHILELKVSRSDWLNEKRDPSKAEPGAALCDAWWLVEGEAGLALLDELPLGCGVLSIGKDGALFQRVAAAKAHGRDKVDRALVAAVLRRLDPMEPRAYWQGKVREAERKGYAKGENAARRRHNMVGKLHLRQEDEELNLP